MAVTPGRGGRVLYSYGYRVLAMQFEVHDSNRMGSHFRARTSSQHPSPARVTSGRSTAMARRDGFRSTSARIGAALGVACVVLGASATDEAPSTRVIPGMRHGTSFRAFWKSILLHGDGATVEEACEASLRRQKVYYANIVRYDVAQRRSGDGV